jgi:hypothetical protein
MVGTQELKNSILPISPHPTPQTGKKKDGLSSVYVQLTHWLHSYSIPRHGWLRFFLPQLLPLLQSTP